MSKDHLGGDGIRLQSLLEIAFFDADYYWPDIPLLLVLGDEEGYAKTGIIRPPGAMNSSTGLLALSSDVSDCPISLDALVIPICSKTGMPGYRTVTVGRSLAADVCLNHHSISKFHAQFLPPREGVRGWRLRDCGSLNGTRLEGLRTTSDDSYRVRGFADVTFGSLHCRFVQPGTLTALVRLMGANADEKSAADTDPDVDSEHLPPVSCDPIAGDDVRRRLPTETWRDF